MGNTDSKNKMNKSKSNYNKDFKQSSNLKNQKRKTSDETFQTYRIRPSKLKLDFVSTKFENKILDQQKMYIETINQIQSKKDKDYFHENNNCENESTTITDSTTNHNIYYSDDIKYKKDNDYQRIIRLKYYSSLQKQGLWNHPMDNIISNIIIFDWDDTLMFSSEYYNYISVKNEESKNLNNRSNESMKSNYDKAKRTTITSRINKTCDNNNFSVINKLNYQYLKPDIDKIKNNFDSNHFKIYFSSKLESLNTLKSNIKKLLSKLVKIADVFIVSNASLKWIYFTSELLMSDNIMGFFDKIKIISARDHFYKEENSDTWKEKSFKKICKSYNCIQPANIIVIGDSNLEIEGSVVFKDYFKNCFLKRIKLKEKPSIEVLSKQIELIDKNYLKIFNSEEDNMIKISNK